MTLPYPYEVETGQLKPRPRFSLPGFDVERRMRDAIQSGAEAVELFGVELPSSAVDTEEFLDQLRAELVERFNERVAAPDATTWNEFAERARAQLERHACLDERVLPMLRATIDGL